MSVTKKLAATRLHGQENLMSLKSEAALSSSHESNSSRFVARVLIALLSGGLAVAAAQTGGAGTDDQQAKKVFHSETERHQAMHNASLFTPTEVAKANIMEGPAQKKKLFQLHYNDKVICDFKTPGSQM